MVLEKRELMELSSDEPADVEIRTRRLVVGDHLLAAARIAGERGRAKFRVWPERRALKVQRRGRKPGR